MARIFDELIELNPALEPLRAICMDVCKKGEAIFGITSQFNVDDIVYFCTVEPEDRSPELLERQEDLTSRAGGTINGGILSEATLLKIRSQLESRQKEELAEILIAPRPGPKKNPEFPMPKVD
ncbi:MAG: hypothetical protein PHE27_02265 [Alphaproteobacteria bacterium]|nr:hypothetical protein [Alphaproteobacteria bacterium]